MRLLLPKLFFVSNFFRLFSSRSQQTKDVDLKKQLELNPNLLWFKLLQHRWRKTVILCLWTLLEVYWFQTRFVVCLPWEDVDESTVLHVYPRLLKLFSNPAKSDFPIISQPLLVQPDVSEESGVQAENATINPVVCLQIFDVCFAEVQTVQGAVRPGGLLQERPLSRLWARSLSGQVLRDVVLLWIQSKETR